MYCIVIQHNSDVLSTLPQHINVGNVVLSTVLQHINVGNVVQHDNKQLDEISWYSFTDFYSQTCSNILLGKD
jgi:hypothetical protein